MPLVTEHHRLRKSNTPTNCNGYVPFATGLLWLLERTLSLLPFRLLSAIGLNDLDEAATQLPLTGAS